MKCCICGKEVGRYGNNPDGALDENGKAIVWGEYDRCCDDCNRKYVVPGRIALLTDRTVEAEKVPGK